MKTFDIGIAQDAVAVKQGEETSLTFTVTNVSGRDLRVLVKLVPENDEHMAWLGIEGEGRREVENARSDSIVVKIKPPQEAPPGAGTFRLVVANEENPDEDFAEAVAQFTVEPGPTPDTPEPRPRRWWIIATAAGAVVAVAVIASLLWPKAGMYLEAGMYAITDVMVTDDTSLVPDEYTGVSKEQRTEPYIPGQVGKRVTASNVNEDIGGRPTSIWVKYERLPEDSDKLVLVDIEVCRWEKEVPSGRNPSNVEWEVSLPGPGWRTASGTSHGREGALTTGTRWPIYKKGLAVKYMPLRDASTRIIALYFGVTPQTATGGYTDPPESVVVDSEHGTTISEKRAGWDIHWSDRPVPAGRCYLMKCAVERGPPPNPG